MIQTHLQKIVLISLLSVITISKSWVTRIPDTLVQKPEKTIHYLAPAVCIGNTCTCPISSNLQLVYVGTFGDQEFWACKRPS